jgi:hypothetical protein
MPVSLTYHLINPAASTEVGSDPGFPGSSTRLVCDVEAFDQQHFLDLIDRLFPEQYLRPLKLNPDAGYEIFQAQGAVAESLSAALHEVECGLVMLYAGGPQYATVAVQLYRENSNAGAVTVLANTLLSTSVGGRQFELTADVVFGPTTLQVIGYARAVAPGSEYNVRGERTTAGGEVLPGEINTIDVALQAPSYGDPTIKVKQEVDAAGGYADWLAGHGANRGLTQADGESEDAFRLRMRTLPDTVTPAAMQRVVGRILDPLGVPWQFVETFDLAYMTCWDAPSPNAGTPTYQPVLPTDPDYNSNLFYWNESPQVVLLPYRNRWLSQDDYTGGFIVEVDRDVTVEDYGFAFDDAGTTFGEFVGSTTGKPRGTPAFDVPDPGEFFAVAALDGADTKREAAISSVYFALQQAKVACAAAIVDFNHTW